MNATARAIAAALAFGLAGSAGATAAQADVGPDSEWHLLPGINVGAVLEDAVADLMLGAEVSAARLYRLGGWYGGYADGVRDFRRDTTRLSLGVEAGYRLIGADLGPIIELGGDETRYGVRARAVLTAAWITVYGGPVIRFGDVGEDGRVTGEIGFLFKVPLPLEGGQLSPVR